MDDVDQLDRHWHGTDHYAEVQEARVEIQLAGAQHTRLLRYAYDDQRFLDHAFV